MLTERTYDSGVFKVLLNIIAICICIEQQLIEILYEILISIMALSEHVITNGKTVVKVLSSNACN